MDSSCTCSSKTGCTKIISALILGISFLLGMYILRQTTTEYVLRSDDRIAQISVSGEGKVSAPPDIAQLNFGVTTGRVPTAKAAMDKLKTSMDAVVTATKRLGVEDKDIATQQLSMNPVYDYTQNGQVPRGFEASQSLSVKVRDLDKIGDVLTAATQAGANQAGGVSFTIDKPEQLQAQARDKAIAQAKAKAKELADQLGVTLVRIREFNESSGNLFARATLRTYDMKSLDAGEAVSALPVPAGEQDITSNVTIMFEIK